VLVKGGFQIAKPATDVYLTLSTNSALISEDDETMPAECNPMVTSAVRQDDSPLKLHHTFTVAERIRARSVVHALSRCWKVSHALTSYTDCRLTL